MVKFLHVSDTHLGKRNYKLVEREKDFFRVFKQIVSLALEKKVDFIVHSGDLFDVGTPSHSVIIRCVKELNRLKKHGIPVFIVPGSHDMHLDTTIISLLEAVGLVTNLAHPRYRRVEKGKLLLSGEVFKGVFLCGVEGRRARIRDLFNNLKIVWPENFNFSIFVFHHTISDVSTLIMDIPTSSLPKGFDYYAAGHWHGVWDKDKIHYPGSTEFCSLTEMKTSDSKFVNLVENGVITKIKLNTRRIIRKTVNVNGLSPREATEKCLTKISEKGNGELLILELEGTLRTGTKGEINKLLINEESVKKGFLHCAVYVKDVKNPDRKVEKVRAISVDELEREHLKELGYSNNELIKAQQVLNLAGKKLNNEELSLLIREIEELLNKP